MIDPTKSELSLSMPLNRGIAMGLSYPEFPFAAGEDEAGRSILPTLTHMAVRWNNQATKSDTTA